MSNDWNISDSAAAIHADALVWDMTLPWQTDLNAYKPGTLQRFKDSGFNMVSLTAADDRHYRDDAVEAISGIVAALRAEEGVVLIRSAEEVEAAQEAGRLAVNLHFQGTNPFQRDITLVQTYYDLGIRHALLAYNMKNNVGDGCHERTDAGLSRFGLDLIAEMNRVGMLVDCTHTGYRTTMEAMEASTAPCIFSHSVSRELNDHERNIWDDQIKACAETGGVVGVNGIGFFMTRENDASVDQLVRHIEHIVGLVGPEHVGLGLDFVYFDEMMLKIYYANPNMFPNGYPTPPWHYFPPEDLPKVTERLLENGHSEKDVRGILGGNFLRVAWEVWK